MFKLRTLVGLIVIGLVLSFAFMAEAEKPNDDVTPAEETVCDGLEGSAFGLCNAYCEAKDCNPYDSTNSCDKVLNNYQKNTGYPGPPCACGDICKIEGEACADGCADGCEESCNDPDYCTDLCSDIDNPIIRNICIKSCNKDCQRACEGACKLDCLGEGIECGISCLEQATGQFCNLHPDICNHDHDY